MDSMTHTIALLLLKRLRGEMHDAEEEQVLQSWAAKDPARTQLISAAASDEVIAQWLTRHAVDLEEGVEARVLLRIKDSIFVNKADGEHMPLPIQEIERPVLQRMPFLKRTWFRYAAAVTLALGLGIASYYLINSDHLARETARVDATQKAEDILPGSQKAVLTLSDGRKMELDSTGSGIITDRGLRIENINGQLHYAPGDMVAMNTMTTPNGGQYQLRLADGTRVWLNAASSITYPTAFTAGPREVSITGEAYFEVQANASQPFLVRTPTEEIKVLGTSFNVNAYADEPAGKTTLISGKVKIGDQLLAPGQAFRGGKVVPTNIAQDIAWKNGVFDFNGLSIEEAARQIGRWYDVEILFEGPASKEKLYGGIDRSATLQGLLKGMEGEFGHFELQGKVLHIRSL